MPIQDLKEQIARLPEQPGVYLWVNRAGETIYVGKARALRDRVRSYLAAAGMSPRHDALLEEITSVEVIVTDSVMEALALENNLIKERSPKYNILLRDDKNYPFLQLTTSEAFPRMLVARHVERDGDFYAGPFLPAKLARRTMGLAHRIFGIRSCNEMITGQRARPCLEYDIKRCIAPCVAEICSQEQYGVAVANARLLLEGRNDELIDTLRERMVDASEQQRFEQAAQLRDALRTVQILRDRQQKVATAQLGDRDVFGLKMGPSGSAIQVFAMRGGRVVERIELVTDPGGIAVRDADVLQAALQQFYEMRVPPAEIDLPLEIEDCEAMEEWLSARAGRRIKILVPQRGDKRALVELATRNAELSYRTRFNENIAAHFDALETLRTVLGLPAVPRRIECFDISTIQGSETVASMVVCEDGRMKKSEYRKFRIKGTSSPTPDRFGSDDFAAMREVVQRRYRKVLEDGGPFPDLILIDGGKGQLTAAYDALEQDLSGNLVAAGIAKEELLFTRAPAGSDRAVGQRSRTAPHRAHPGRGAPLRGDLSPQGEDHARSTVAAGRGAGIGPRRRRCAAHEFGSLAASAVPLARSSTRSSVRSGRCGDRLLREVRVISASVEACGRIAQR
jgi:excinuclease ABC subunit C